MDREVIERNECVNKIEIFVRNFGKSRLWKGEDAKELVLALCQLIVPLSG